MIPNCYLGCTQVGNWRSFRAWGTDVNVDDPAIGSRFHDRAGSCVSAVARRTPVRAARASHRCSVGRWRQQRRGLSRRERPTGVRDRRMSAPPPTLLHSEKLCSESPADGSRVRVVDFISSDIGAPRITSVCVCARVRQWRETASYPSPRRAATPPRQCRRCRDRNKERKQNGRRREKERGRGKREQRHPT